MNSEKKKRIVVGLTGGIASGKSAVLKCFKKLGAKTLDSDRIAREAVKKGKPALKKIVETFGKEFVKNDGSLDRQKMAELIFKNKRKRKELENIIHPYVIEILKKNIQSFRSGVLVVDIPLLFEANLQLLVDRTVVVWVSKNTQIKRLMDRDNISKSEILLRIMAQWSLNKKKNLADFVIDNSGSPEKTWKQSRAIWSKIL